MGLESNLIAVRKYQLAHAEQVRLRSKKYRQRYPDRVKLSQAKSRAKRVEQNRIRLAAYHRANREKISQRKRRNRLLNPEKFKARFAKWYRDNPGKNSERHYRRRALKAAASITDLEAIRKWQNSWRKKKTVKCYWCGRRKSPKKCHMDHIHPLGKLGPHSLENLCISCADCNFTKRDKDLETWNTKIQQPVLF